MTRALIVFIFLCILPSTVFAIDYLVYEPDTPDAYILRPPTPGLYLGAMIRQLNLEPDWTNRQWIQLIHRANPDLVDPKGEILAHDNDLRFPLSALKRLKGYQNLENHFTTVTPEKIVSPSEEAMPESVSEPVVTEEQQTINQTETSPTPTTTDESSPSTYRFDFLIGSGVEDINIDNGIGSDASLSSGANFVGQLGFKTQFSENHQIHLHGIFQYKNYMSPPSVNVVEDLNFLLDFKYGYGYRMFKNVFLRLIGQSQQLNFGQYRGALIDLHTLWIQSFGLQLDSPLFDVGYKQISFEFSGLYSLSPQADFDIDPGYRFSFGFKLEPQGFESGWMFNIQASYHNQIPSNFASHSSIEGLGLIGYSF